MSFSIDFDEFNRLLRVNGVAGDKVNDNVNKDFRILKNIGDNNIKKLCFVSVFICEVVSENVSEKNRNCCVLLDEINDEHENLGAADLNLAGRADVNIVVACRNGITESRNRLEEFLENACAQFSCFFEEFALFFFGNAILSGGVDLCLRFKFLGVVKEVANAV